MAKQHQNAPWRAQCKQDKAFDIFNTIFMAIMFLVFAWPLWFVLIASFSDPSATWNGEVLLWPVGFNLECYKEVFSYTDLWIGYRNTIFYTVVGTIINLIMTICAAYPLSRKDFMMRNFFMVMFMITMYFGGGLIPTYLVVQKLNMLDTVWAILIPSACSIFNVIITRTYFQTNIPETLQEAAELDGANTFQFLTRIVLPLSGPILAVMALYYGVGRWNSFFDALIYLQDKDLYPLQMFLRNILIQNTVNVNTITVSDPAQQAAKAQLAQTIKYGVIVVASVPLLCIYPFVQKYFVKGVMIGAIKG